MSIRIEISSALQSYTKNRGEILLDATNLTGIYEGISSNYPDLADKIFSENNELMSYVSVFVDSRNVRGIDPGDVVLRDDSKILILPAISGG